MFLLSYFTFNFYNEDTEQSTMLRFNISGSEELYKNFYKNIYEQYYDEVVSDLEGEYGVHDVSGHLGDLEGFISYEVEPDMYMECMQKHHTWFKENSRFHIGEIYEVHLNEEGGEIMSKADEEQGNIIWEELDRIRNEVAGH